MKKLKIWSMMMLIAMALPLMVACGGDDDGEPIKKEVQVFPNYIFTSSMTSYSYVTPDFTNERGSIKIGEINYMFRYLITLVDEKKYKYEFTLIEDVNSSSYTDAQIVWITDKKYNFTIQWNDTLKEYDIIEGYFKGGKFGDFVLATGFGIYDSLTEKYYDMKTVLGCYIYHNDLKVHLGVPR